MKELMGKGAAQHSVELMTRATSSSNDIHTHSRIQQRKQTMPPCHAMAKSKLQTTVPSGQLLFVDMRFTAEGEARALLELRGPHKCGQCFVLSKRVAQLKQRLSTRC
eukprot:3449182-Amphidinium_carterae.1